LVYPDADTALERLTTTRVEGVERCEADLIEIELAGYSGFSISDSEGAQTIIAVGPVIVSALADRRQLGDPTLRSLVNCLALLDHVQSILQRTARQRPDVRAEYAGAEQQSGPGLDPAAEAWQQHV
jgi:hypothetical protein